MKNAICDKVLACVGPLEGLTARQAGERIDGVIAALAVLARYEWATLDEASEETLAESINAVIEDFAVSHQRPRNRQFAPHPMVIVKADGTSRWALRSARTGEVVSESRESFMNSNVAMAANIAYLKEIEAS